MRELDPQEVVLRSVALRSRFQTVPDGYNLIPISQKTSPLPRCNC
ncbi:hypothetical protein [Roseofilum casamattae]|uniref:Uncharacterized protein n=1 Tax=Roseofilum casamattae BLCC-M143 TaxID=3022442 RepID=A0ABT7BXI5_9CYAN|nr:hypothetical protein [Roseofilum casamattae]MDJ1183881.1 hypothetical protein [Roseofilum casamattae BLCC-M143]